MPNQFFDFLTSNDPFTRFFVNLGMALLVMVITIVLARYGKGWLVRILTRSKINLNVATLLGNLMQVVVVLVGLITALTIFGIELTSQLTVVGAVGIALSLSMQDLLKNIVAGTVILMEQPFRIGDRISVKDVTGVVQGIELRTTILRTDDHLQVVVPNNTVLTEVITNRSSNSVQRTTVQMRIKRNDIAEVTAQIKTILSGVPDVAQSPEPVIGLEGVFEEIARIRIDFWLLTSKKPLVIPSVIGALQAHFPEANLKVVG